MIPVTPLNCHRVFVALAPDVAVVRFIFSRPTRLGNWPVVDLSVDGHYVGGYEARLLNALNRADTAAAAAVHLSNVARSNR